MMECCKNCKYYRVLKHNFKQCEGFEISHCCVIFANEDDSFVLEVGENDMCEMYSNSVNESKCIYNHQSVLDGIDGFMCDLTGDWYNHPCEKFCKEGK